VKKEKERGKREERNHEQGQACFPLRTISLIYPFCNYNQNLQH